jgi:hypothetical protein
MSRFATRSVVVLAIPLLVAAASPADAVVAARTAAAGPAEFITGVGSLEQVAATSAGNAWAVGATDGKTMILRWNDGAWGQVPSPSPGPATSGLNGVAATSASNAWAVGNATDSKGNARGIILHWTGEAWTQVPSAGGAIYLEGVAATSASNAWAVGESTGGQELILRWNGTAWKRVGIPAGIGTFNGVTAISATDAWAWATGSYQVMLWNGKVWRQTAIPSLVLVNAVAATSASNAWAVGYTGPANAIRTVILHWNGTKWQRVPSPSPGLEPVLDGVAVVSARNAWAVGVSYKKGSGSTMIGENLILHWNGTQWSQVSSPSLGTASSLLAVAATSAGNAWAVGNTEGSQDSTYAGQILRWNGSSWK